MDLARQLILPSLHSGFRFIPSFSFFTGYQIKPFIIQSIFYGAAIGFFHKNATVGTITP